MDNNKNLTSFLKQNSWFIPAIEKIYSDYKKENDKELDIETFKTLLMYISLGYLDNIKLSPSSIKLELIDNKISFEYDIYEMEIYYIDTQYVYCNNELKEYLIKLKNAKDFISK